MRQEQKKKKNHIRANVLRRGGLNWFSRLIYDIKKVPRFSGVKLVPNASEYITRTG